MPLLSRALKLAAMTSTLSHPRVRAMTTVLDEYEPESPYIHFSGVSWELYESLLQVVGNRPIDRAVNRERIYAALGVPELWRYDDERLTAFRLTPRPLRGAKGATSIKKAEIRKRRYVAIEKSLSFPFLEIDELAPFLKIGREVGESTLFSHFRIGCDST
jgi:hypothetical protein